MQKSGAADRADFAVAEKASKGHGPELFLENLGVMVGPAI
jgi:hypothetical protein